MNYADLSDHFQWHQYAGQKDRGVTYLFVLNRPVHRLAGSSDILYIGKTEQTIRSRFEQETRTNNSARNTQQTNIRTTFIFGKLDLENVRCFYSKSLFCVLGSTEHEKFMGGLRTWDKKTYIALSEPSQPPKPGVSLEKYLLVRYASDHLEVPPLNNRM